MTAFHHIYRYSVWRARGLSAAIRQWNREASSRGLSDSNSFAQHATCLVDLINVMVPGAEGIGIKTTTNGLDNSMKLMATAPGGLFPSSTQVHGKALHRRLICIEEPSAKISSSTAIDYRTTQDIGSLFEH
jgi:hypothetical protein